MHDLRRPQCTSHFRKERWYEIDARSFCCVGILRGSVSDRIGTAGTDSPIPAGPDSDPDRGAHVARITAAN
jgi:hypothetical protein